MRIPVMASVFGLYLFSCLVIGFIYISCLCGGVKLVKAGRFGNGKAARRPEEETMRMTDEH